MKQYSALTILLAVFSISMRSSEGPQLPSSMFCGRDLVLSRDSVWWKDPPEGENQIKPYIPQYLRSQPSVAVTTDGKQIDEIYVSLDWDPLERFYIEEHPNYKGASQNLEEHRKQGGNIPTKVSRTQRIVSYAAGTISAGIAWGGLQWMQSRALIDLNLFAGRGVLLLSFLVVQQCMLYKFQQDINAKNAEYDQTSASFQANVDQQKEAAKKELKEFIRNYIQKCNSVHEKVRKTLGLTGLADKVWKLNLSKDKLRTFVLRARSSVDTAESCIPCVNISAENDYRSLYDDEQGRKQHNSSPRGVARTEQLQNPADPIAEPRPQTPAPPIPTQVLASSSSSSSSASSSSKATSSPSDGLPLLSGPDAPDDGDTYKALRSVEDEGSMKGEDPMEMRSSVPATLHSLFPKSYELPQAPGWSHCSVEELIEINRELEELLNNAHSLSFDFKSLGNEGFYHAAYMGLTNGTYVDWRKEGVEVLARTEVSDDSLCTLLKDFIVLQDKVVSRLWYCKQCLTQDIRNKLKSHYPEICK